MDNHITFYRFSIFLSVFVIFPYIFLACFSPLCAQGPRVMLPPCSFISDTDRDAQFLGFWGCAAEPTEVKTGKRAWLRITRQRYPGCKTKSSKSFFSSSRTMRPKPNCCFCSIELSGGMPTSFKAATFDSLKA